MRPVKIQKLIQYIIVGGLLFAAGLGLARGGDAFLSFIWKRIHVRLEYENNSGFISCFLLRSIKLDKPRFHLEDINLTIESESALVTPFFNELWAKKAVTLDCALQNASFSGKLPTMPFGELNDLVFDDMRARLLIYGETVEFKSFEAQGNDVKMRAFGFANESGDFAIDAKVFFSSKSAGELPEEIRMLLQEESGGWYSYTLDLDKKNGIFSLKLESESIKIDFETLKTR